MQTIYWIWKIEIKTYRFLLWIYIQNVLTQKTTKLFPSDESLPGNFQFIKLISGNMHFTLKGLSAQHLIQKIHQPSCQRFFYSQWVSKWASDSSHSAWCVNTRWLPFSDEIEQVLLTQSFRQDCKLKFRLLKIFIGSMELRSSNRTYLYWNFSFLTNHDLWLSRNPFNTNQHIGSLSFTAKSSYFPHRSA